MMDLLLAWYAAIAIGFGASVYRATREAEPPPVRAKPAWLSNMIAYAEPLEDHFDDLFFADTDIKEAHDGSAQTSRQ